MLQKEAACWRNSEIRLVHFGRCTCLRVGSAGMHRVDREQQAAACGVSLYSGVKLQQQVFSNSLPSSVYGQVLIWCAPESHPRRLVSGRHGCSEGQGLKQSRLTPYLYTTVSVFSLLIPTPPGVLMTGSPDFTTCPQRSPTSENLAPPV